MPEQPRKSLFRRLNFGKKGGVAVAFSVAEELWGPSKHDARVVVEAQQRVGAPAPAPADPPDLAASLPSVQGISVVTDALVSYGRPDQCAEGRAPEL